jgi:hypothetical protein
MRLRSLAAHVESNPRGGDQGLSIGSSTAA